MSGLRLERWWPYAASVAVTTVWWFGLSAPFPSDPEALLGATGNVSAVLVGFLATAKAIVLGLTGSPVFQRLKAEGYHYDLFGYFFDGILAGVLFLAVSVIGFFMPEKTPTWYTALWVLTGSLTLFLFLRVVHILTKFLRHA